MKKIILLFTLSVLLFSCQDPATYPKYTLATGRYLPVENQEKLATFIKETVSASNLHMTGGDYEDPEDVVEQAEETGRGIYEIKVDGLYVQDTPDSFYDFIPEPEFSAKERAIFNQLNK